MLRLVKGLTNDELSYLVGNMLAVVTLLMENTVKNLIYTEALSRQKCLLLHHLMFLCSFFFPPCSFLCTTSKFLSLVFEMLFLERLASRDFSYLDFYPEYSVYLRLYHIS